MKTKTKSPTNLYFIFFLLIYFVVLTYLAGRIYIWEDESYSLNTSSHNLAEVLKLSYNFEGQPPFYFVLLALWRLINSSIFFARMLSVVFIASSAYFFERLCGLVTGKKNVRWLVVVFLLNPFTVWAALEIRLYALVVLLSTLSVYYFLRFYIENRNKYLYILMVVSLIGLYTQYFFVFLITSFAIGLLIFKNKTIFFKFCLYCAPVILLFLPNLIFIPDQLSMAQTHLNVNVKHIFDVIRTPQDFIMSLGSLPLSQLSRWIIKIPFILVFGFAFFKVMRDEAFFNSAYKKILKLILFMLFVCMVLYIILVPSLSLIFQEKYMIITFSLFVLLFSVLNVLPKTEIFFGAISLYFICLLAVKYRYPEKTYNFKLVSDYIEKVEMKNEPVIFYGKSILPPFNYYYNGTNPLYPLPAIKYDKDYYEERITDTSDLNKEIESINSGNKSMILVTESITGFKYKKFLTREMIQKSLRDHYLISLDSTFQSRNSDNFLRVQRIEKKE